MSAFQRGYCFGFIAASLAWGVYLLIDDYLVKATFQPVKLVVLDRRDMADNADTRKPN